MDSKQFHKRTWAVVILLAVMLGGLGLSMYQTQIVRGAYYASQSSQKIVNIETVEAGRGEITDSYGRVLVTNRIGYQVTLDTSRMGSASKRNQILLELLDICREEGVSWNDSLAISQTQPFVYTSDDPFYVTSTNEDGTTTRSSTRLYRLAVKMGWISESSGASLPTASELLEEMCASFHLEEEWQSDPERARGAVGVLYELYLRSQDIYRTSYVFANDSSVDIDFISRVKENGLAGVTIEPTSIRQYNTTYAAHLLGRVALMSAEEWDYYQTVDLDGDGSPDYQMDDSVGKEGVEQAFESYLRGTAGTRSVDLNLDGKVVSEEWIEDPEPGGNVVLTLDIELQRVVEDSLAAHVPQLSDGEAEGAAAVIIDVKNGAVLACASYPTFDLSRYSADYNENVENPLNPLYNRATLGTYAPGSTFKMVTGIAGLEEDNIITPTTQILDTGVYRYYSDNGPMCWIYRQYGTTHGLQNVSQAITNSCNVFFFDVGRRVGIEKLQEYASMFGLGQATGIEVPESVGVMAGPEYTASMGQTWYDGNTLSVAIGQESSQFTPLQLANYIATLVNGGTHYQVHLLKAVKSSDYSQVLYEYEPTVLNTLDLDPENVDAVKKGMLALTQTGSLARYFRDLDVEVGAKTGSAQLSASSSDSDALLVCFAPYDDPEIAMAIVAEKGGSGAELGTIAAEIMEYYFSAQQAQEQVYPENTLVR